jgi:hypothetical protein
MTGTAQPDDFAWLDTVTSSSLVSIFSLCQRPVSPCHRRKETETPEAQGKMPRPQMDSARVSHHAVLDLEFMRKNWQWENFAIFVDGTSSCIHTLLQSKSEQKLRWRGSGS